MKALDHKINKILVVTDYFYPHWTGLSKSIYYLLEFLKDSYGITVLTVRHLKNLKREEFLFLDKIRVIRSDYVFSLSRSKYSIGMIFNFLMLVKNYDIVMVHSPCANILPISLIAKFFRKKLLIFYHGDLILPKGFKNKVIEKIFDMSSLLACFLANKISTFTLDYAQHSRILKHYLSNFYPLLWPISINKDKTAIKKYIKSNIKKLQKLREEDKSLFGFGGRFVEEKGFDILFDAIPKVIKKIPGAHFVFAGETKIPYENFYQRNLPRLRKVAKHVTFLGFLKRKDLIDFYRSIVFIILPSRSDCFPLVQAEAVLLQTPSIVSNIPGARVVIKETGFGLIFNKEDSDDLASKIIEAYKEREVILKRYKEVLRFFDNKKNVEKIKEFIEN